MTDTDILSIAMDSYECFICEWSPLASACILLFLFFFPSYFFLSAVYPCNSSSPFTFSVSFFNPFNCPSSYYSSSKPIMSFYLCLRCSSLLSFFYLLFFSNNPFDWVSLVVDFTIVNSFHHCQWLPPLSMASTIVNGFHHC